MIPLGTLRVILELIFGKVFYGQLSAVYENSERVNEKKKKKIGASSKEIIFQCWDTVRFIKT